MTPSNGNRRESEVKNDLSDFSMISTTTRKNEGSLLRLFQSELFDIYFHMYYLYNRPESGVQDYLVNLLFRRSNDEISFYLPQLCCLSVMRYHESTLGRFLVAKSSTSMNFALKLSWWFKALADTSNEEIRAVSLELYQNVEMAIVNSRSFLLGTSLRHMEPQTCIPDLFRRRRAIEYIQALGRKNRPSLVTATSHHDAENITDQSHPDSLKDGVSLNAPFEKNDFPFASELPSNFIPVKVTQSESVPDSLCLKSSPPIDADSPILTSGSNDNDFNRTDFSSCKEFDDHETEGEGHSIPSNKPRVLSHSSPLEKVKPLKTSSSSGQIKSTGEPIKVTIRPGFFKRKGVLKVSNCIVRLPSVHTRLGSPFSSVSFLDALSVDPDLQQYIIKQRRCDYYNCVNAFINTLSEISYRLAHEPNHALRISLLKHFLISMNEWIFARRCLVASLRGTFFMTGLMIPLTELMSNKLFSRLPKYSDSHSIQIVRFIAEECRVLSSKTRAPFLLVFEVADLDEDLDDFPQDEIVKSEHVSSEEEPPDQKEMPNVSTELWKNLYVYECILNEVKSKNLYIPISEEHPDFDYQTESPLRALRRCMGFQKKGTKVDTLVDDSSATANNKEEVGPPSPDSSYRLKTLEKDETPQENSTKNYNTIEVELDESFLETYDSHSGNQSPSKDDKMKKKEALTSASREAKNTTSSLKMTVGELDTHPTLVSQPESSPRVSETSQESYGNETLISKSLENKHRSSISSSIFSQSSMRVKNAAENSKTTCGPSPNTPCFSQKAAEAPSVRKRLWGPIWSEQKERYRKISCFGRLKSWNLSCVLVKGGDDVRQEMLASQLIQQFDLIFKNAEIPLYLRPYDILVTGANSGIMVFVPDTVSFDLLKKNFGADSIAKVFESSFADSLYQAKKNFIESHAAYSLVGYLLQVKDRHNGNYLLDAEGHVIHIDYGYMLSNSPGSVNFEASPFKLTLEFLDIMDGEHSDNYEYFRQLLIQGFLEVRKHADRLLLLVEAILSMPKMPCFLGNPETAFSALKKRFMLNLTDEVCIQKINELLDVSVNNWRSVQYDTFQRLTNGIL